MKLRYSRTTQSIFFHLIISQYPFPVAYIVSLYSAMRFKYTYHAYIFNYTQTTDCSLSVVSFENVMTICVWIIYLFAVLSRLHHICTQFMVISLKSSYMYSVLNLDYIHKRLFMHMHCHKTIHTYSWRKF